MRQGPARAAGSATAWTVSPGNENTHSIKYTILASVKCPVLDVKDIHGVEPPSTALGPSHLPRWTLSPPAHHQGLSVSVGLIPGTSCVWDPQGSSFESVSLPQRHVPKGIGCSRSRKAFLLRARCCAVRMDHRGFAGPLRCQPWAPVSSAALSRRVQVPPEALVSILPGVGPGAGLPGALSEAPPLSRSSCTLHMAASSDQLQCPPPRQHLFFLCVL